MRELSGDQLSDIVFWVIACVSGILVVTLLLVVGGVISSDPPAAPEAVPVSTVEQPATTAPPESIPRTESTTTSTAPTVPEQVVVVLAAVRGDSWFSARVGSESGRVLDERVLAQGESVRLTARRVWLSLGAAGNVEVTVDGKPRALAPGTVSVVLAPTAAPAAN